MVFNARSKYGIFVFLIFCVSLGIADIQASEKKHNSYTLREVVDAGHNFFGTVSGALAELVERSYAKHGLPNGYILGEEAGGAFIGGVRYGEGILYTKDSGDYKLYWQGPSIGLDYGLDGNRTMILVYGLENIEQIYERYFGVSGSAFAIGGVGMTFLRRNKVVLVPIRTGVGARLGINIGYLKITKKPEIIPF